LLPLVLLVSFAVVRADVAATTNGQEEIQRAAQLYHDGKEAEAFLVYLAIPGAEHVAGAVARAQPQRFLEILRTRGQRVPGPSSRLIEGDLLRALGQKEAALECYRQVVVPVDGYFVEPPSPPGGLAPGDPRWSSGLPPFSAGPGSHRDNWLIRRFIALEAQDDAAREFARIWEIHRRFTQPYVTTRTAHGGGAPEGAVQRVVVRPPGFDGLGLQFALDYAYFLKRRDESDRSLALLLEPLLLMDMDRNPDDIAWEEPVAAGQAVALPERRREETARRLFLGLLRGVSRKEYIRLAYGEFKAAKKIDRLIAALQGQIAAGQNRARRIMARVRLHEGSGEEALRLELAFIAAGGFDAFTAAYRRGLVYEALQNLPQAAAEFETVLRLPYTPPRLPDRDEEASEERLLSAVVPDEPAPDSPAGRLRFRSQVMDRLQRIDSALGRPEKVLNLILRQLELDEARMTDPVALEETARRFQDAGRGEKFAAWGKARLDRIADPIARANLAWVLGDLPATIRALAAVTRAKGGLGDWFGFWERRFRVAGKDHLRDLLRAMLEANADAALARLALSELEGTLDGPEGLRALEGLLDGGDAAALRDVASVSRFRNRFDMACHLMRRYEAMGDDTRIVALGFRVLEGAPPFQRLPSHAALPTPKLSHHSRDDFALRDTLRCAYGMLPHVTKADDRARLRTLADRSDCIPLKNQVARLIDAGRAPRLDPADEHRRHYRRVTVRTLGLLTGNRILTRRDDIRCLSPDGRWIGTSWGLVRHRVTEDDTLEVLQIPLETSVNAFLATPAGLFVATDRDLFRLDDPDGATPAPVIIAVRPALPSDLAARELRLSQLLWWGDALWIDSHWWSYVLRYDPDRKDITLYRDIQGSPFVGAGRLWKGDSVLDEADGLFKPLNLQGGKLLGSSGADVWCDVWINEQAGYRLARVDPHTLEVHPLPIAGAPSSPPRQLGSFSSDKVLGNDPARVWFGRRNSATFIYDRASDALTMRDDRFNDGLFSERRDPAAFRGPVIWRLSDGYFFRYDCDSGASEPIAGLDPRAGRGPFWCMVERPDGKRLVGCVLQNMSPEFERGGREVYDLEGGLYEVDPRTMGWQRLDSRAEELTEARVKRIVFDDEQRRAYVCTDGGVSVLSLPEGRLLTRITTMDGLPSNRVEDVARIGSKLYLGCAHDLDHDAGLAVLDLRSGLFQVLSTSDGLACDNIQRLRAEGTRLHILYGSVHPNWEPNLRQDGRWVRWIENERPVLGHPSSILETRTGAIADGAEFAPGIGPGNRVAGAAPAQAPPATVPSPAPRPPQLPYLGGGVLVDVRHGATRFIGGPRGLVLVDLKGGAEPGAGSAVRFRIEPVRPDSPPRGRLAEAERKPLRIETPEDLTLALGDKNPYFRARAVASLLREGTVVARFLTPLTRALDDPDPRVRGTALYFVTRLNDDKKAVPLLRKRFDDQDDLIRAAVVVELATRGNVPDLSRLRQALHRRGGFGSLPFGLTGTIELRGVREGILPQLEAIRRHASPEVLALLLEYPLRYHESWKRDREYLEALGRSLRDHPEVAGTLLKLEDGPEPDIPIKFSRVVFRSAGVAMLRVLHAALTSPDRVVRSNAARACAAIGDRASIPLLIQALDLESGLSRASIVRALGELKAEAALPRLVELYVDARNDEKRRGGTGYLTSQAAAVALRQYEEIRDLDAIGSELDALKESGARRPRAPGYPEDLLDPGGILNAVRTIGTAAAQDFYRKLAAETDDAIRQHAAEQLAEGRGVDQDLNLPVLRDLLADSSVPVRMSAAVSLLTLGQDEGQTAILEALRSHDRSAPGIALWQLRRLKDRGRLDFARATLEALVRDQAVDEPRRHDAAKLLGDKQVSPP
jgi:HEAT repeat protein